MKPFPWRAGMRRLCDREDFDRVLEVVTTSDGNLWLCVETDEQGALENGDASPSRCRGWIRAAAGEPDANDGATKGAFLDAIREAWDAPCLHVRPEIGQSGAVIWRAWNGAPLVDVAGCDITGPTEFSALLAAWEAAP